RTPAEARLIDQFRASKAALPGNAAVALRREEAFATFAAGGLPTRRVEAWHYTDLRALMREARPWAPPPDASTVAAVRAQLDAEGPSDSVRLVIIDSVFIPEASDLDRLPAGVQVSSLAAALAEGRAAVVQHLAGPEIAQGDVAFALNAAFMRDGVVVEVAPHTDVRALVRIVNHRTAATATASAARALVLVGASATVTIIEEHVGEAGEPTQTNDALQFTLGDGARVEHVAIQRLPPGALCIATLTADLGARATFNSFAFSAGASVVRRQLFVRCGGGHAKTALGGVSLLNARQHGDTTLVVDHAAPAGESRERFKHIIDDEAVGIFQGKVIVRRGAQKTDGGMKSNALLLSEAAAMNNRPELEIFADDVICGHGATCGALDDNQLFYLMARGLPRQEAEALLLEAFAGEALDQVADEGLREVLMRHVREWLAARAASLPQSGFEPVGPAERSIIGNRDRTEA
ncbi:MAG: Fe-S cluster assembly protein SufD, partial [Methylobacteriaceae bacterium]|nr:Fe-S cluster assembly protein SufD [Methylobacteriaceae bacterium]